MTDAHDETSESSAKGNSWSDVLAAGSESMGKTVWQNMAIAPVLMLSGDELKLTRTAEQFKVRC